MKIPDIVRDIKFAPLCLFRRLVVSPHVLRGFYLVMPLLLLSLAGCDRPDNSERLIPAEKNRNAARSTKDDAAAKGKLAAGHFLETRQIIPPWRDDADYLNELSLAIEKNEQNIDPETGFLWATHRQPKGYHSQFELGTPVRPTRETMYHAAMLIASPQPARQRKGCQLFEKVIALQDQNPASATFGLWPWYYEEPLAEMASPDGNWADFLGVVLATVLHDYADRLSPELLEKTRQSLQCASRAIINRDVKPGYTNIAMMGATVIAAAGELLDRKDFLDYGRMRIRRNLEHYRETGNFNEYNSPNYTPVVIQELERMLYLVDDSTCREVAAELLIGAWQTVAEHYHIPTQQWAGPFSRTYSDTISPRLRNTILAQAFAISPEECAALPENEAVIFSPFAPRLACPEQFRSCFTELPPGEITRHHVFNKARRDRPEIGTTWLTPNATLGTASYHTFWAQSRGLIGYWNVPDSDEPVVFKLSFLHDGRDFASACARHRQSSGKVLSAFGLLRNRGSMHPTFDRPDDGTFVAESFEIVYQLKSPGLRMCELSENVFELSSGPIRAVLHVADNCVFDGQPVTWQLEQSVETQTVKLVGVCYRGEPKAFPFDALGETRIAVGLELLQGDQKPSPCQVTLTEAKTLTTDKAPSYAVQWEPVTGAGPKNALIAPALPGNH